MFVSRVFVVLIVFFSAGCAHPIKITPNINDIDRKDVSKIDKSVGYYISEADRGLSVITPGGAGDKVEYTPYKDLEPALQKVLSNMFQRVHKITSLQDSAFIKANDISYIFFPKIETNSSSTALLTWMATDFTVKLDCKAIDESGQILVRASS